VVPPLEQPCWPRQAAHCSFQARRERAHPDIGCREQDLWSSLLPRLRGIFPRLRHLQVAAVRQHCRYNHLTPLSAALDPLTLCMCSCFSPAQRFQLRFENAGSWSNRRAQCTRILYAVVVVGAARGRARAAAGVKLFGMSVTRSRCEPTLSALLERMPCSPAHHHASSCLPGYPTLRARKSGPHTRTTGSLERRAPLRRPTWQDASFLRTRWIQRESGGTRVLWRAPVVIWSSRPCSGVVRGYARPVQRSLMYVQ
jgi:hypothetical protein